jgi:hypothetical protein
LKKETYYKILMVICLLHILNVMFVMIYSYYFYGFSASSLDVLSVCILIFSLLLMCYKNIWGMVLLFVLNLYGYCSFFDLGMRGYSFPGNTHWQPVLATWLEIITILFCIVGGLFVYKGLRGNHECH